MIGWMTMIENYIQNLQLLSSELNNISNSLRREAEYIQDSESEIFNFFYDAEAYSTIENLAQARLSATNASQELSLSAENHIQEYIKIIRK